MPWRYLLIKFSGKAAMNLPDFLTEVPFGEIRLTGSRIGLYHVIYDFNHGYSLEQLHEEFPDLSRELLNKVLEFYKQNRAEVDAYMARCEEESERQRSLGKPIDVEELFRRWRATGRTELP
jgi:uncharacterized protein (DUF433 family)